MSFITDKMVEHGFHASDTVSRFPLGAKAETSDGRIFRYIRNSTAALVAGNLQQAPAVVANHQDLVPTAAAVGAKSVTVTLGATLVAANDYSEGYMVVNTDPGEGHTYKVKSHPAADSAATLVLTLEDPIVVALTATSRVSLYASPYNRPVLSAAAQTGTAIGVAPIALAASAFGWVQSRGPCSVLADENITAGQMLTIGSSTPGSVEAQDAAGEPQVGVALQAGVDGESRIAVLTID